DEVGGDVGAGAGPVLDDELLAERVAQLRRHQPREHVRVAAGGEADQHAHGFLGPGLRESVVEEKRRPCKKGDREGSHPQTLRAVSTTTSSLRFWSSSVTRLPITSEAKPHCGLSAS